MSNREIGKCNSYLRARLNLLSYGNIKFIINHLDSKLDPGIQFADFVAGAINEKCRDNNEEWLNMLDSKKPTIHEMFEQDL